MCCECGNYSFRYSCECLFLKVYRLFALGDDDCVDCECVRDIEEMFTRVLFIFCIVGILALWSFCFVLSFLFFVFFSWRWGAFWFSFMFTTGRGRVCAISVLESVCVFIFLFLCVFLFGVRGGRAFFVSPTQGC